MSKKQKNAIKKTAIEMLHCCLFGLAVATFYAHWILKG